jgi:hypothetical protein
MAAPDDSVSCHISLVPCGMKAVMAELPPRYFPAPPESVFSRR